MDILTPINQDTLADRVTKQFREAIIRGTLRPDTRLAEPALAAELGVSRSPVREALSRLENDGLVRKKANRGYYVWSPNAADVDEILSLRVMMESLAAELIINKLTPEDFVKIEKIVDQQKQAVEANRLFRLTEADRRFHAYFVEKAGNRRLLNMWNQIMGQWEVLVFRRAEYDPAVPKTVLTDHRDIIQAFEKKNQAQVVDVHRKINLRVGREMKTALQKQ